MVEAFPGILAALGIILVGYRYFNSLMRGITSRNMRMVVSRWTPNGFMASGWGLTIGLLLQDMNVVVGIVSSLLATGVLSRRKAVLVMIASNLGAVLFYYVVFANASAVILTLVGLAGFLVFLDKPVRWRNVVGCLFFLCSMIYGVMLVGSQASLLATAPALAGISETVRGLSPSVVFLGGCVVALSTYVNLPWIVLTAALFHATMLTLDQVMMVIYGLTLGAACRSLWIARRLEGFGRQTFVIQGCFNGTVALLFGGLFYLGVWSGSHMMRDLVFTGGRFEWEMVNLIVFIKAVVALLALLLLRPICAILEWSYESADEQLTAAPKFLSSDYPYDLDSAGDLVHQEIVELAKKMPAYLEQRLVNPQEADVAQLSRHSYFVDVARQLEDFTRQQMNSQVSVTATARFFHVVDELHRLSLLEEVMHKLGQIVLPADCSAHSKTLFVQMLESQHALVSTLSETLASGQPEDWELLHQMTAHEGSFFEGIRQAYFDTETGCSQEEKGLVFDLTNFIKLAAWLIHQWQRFESQAVSEEA